MSRQWRQHVVRLAGIMLGIVLAALLVRAGLVASRASAGAGASRVLAADAVLAQPRRYLHQAVTVEGQVEQVWPGGAFVLRSDRVRQGLLVLPADPAALRAGQRVQAWGSVRMLSRAEARALGGALAAAHLNRPYVLAQEVRPSGGQGSSATREPGR